MDCTNCTDTINHASYTDDIEYMNHTSYVNSRNVNANSDFPYLVLNRKNNTTVPVTPGFHVYHWHTDLQFVYVMEGTVCVKTLEKKEVLHAGEGIFINKNVVHMTDQMGECMYKCFIFPEQMVSFYPGSPVMRITQTITDNPAIPLIRLSWDIAWCQEALRILQKLVQIEAEKSKFYYGEVLTNLSMLWLTLLKNVNVPERISETSASIRMRKILTFIEKHYAEDLSLDKIARSAEISNSEALRCFKQTLQTTPYHYLMEFRLQKAENLLIKTSLSIGQIAAMTGFNEQAYFGKCFRKKMNCSPRDYRKKNL